VEKAVRTQLLRLGVGLIDGEIVTEVRHSEIMTDKGRSIACDICVWSGGLRSAPLARIGHSALDRLAWASHRLFYIAVLGMAGSGLVMALQTGLPSIVFAGHGALPPDFWAYPVRTIHYGISRLLMTLIALHVAGALYHTFFLKDRLLRRMGFGRRATVATMSTAPALNGSFPEVQS
jgi:hypothetical protein